MRRWRWPRRLVDELTQGPEVFRVQVSAADAGQPASGPGQPVGRIDGQRIAAVLAADRDGYDGDYAHYHACDKDGDGDDYDTGHDGLQYFRPAELRPQVPLSAIAAWRAALADPACVGHCVPLCPRSVRTVQLARFSPTVRLARTIRQVLVHPSSRTARIAPMLPAIQAIPTSGISGMVLPRRRWV